MNHENWSKQEGLKECVSCELCDPERFQAKVTIQFLKICKRMFEDLCNADPLKTAPGWLIEINGAIEECRKNGYKKEKVDPPYKNQKRVNNDWVN